MIHALMGEGSKQYAIGSLLPAHDLALSLFISVSLSRSPFVVLSISLFLPVWFSLFLSLILSCGLPPSSHSVSLSLLLWVSVVLKKQGNYTLTYSSESCFHLPPNDIKINVSLKSKRNASCKLCVALLWCAVLNYTHTYTYAYTNTHFHAFYRLFVF